MNSSTTTMLPEGSTDCEVHGLNKFAMEFQHPHGVLTFIISILGIIFNLLNMAVLTNIKMRTPVNLLLTMLSLTELILFTIYAPYILLFNVAPPAGSTRYATDDITLAYYLLFYADASVFLHLSAIWLIITTACFRFLLVQFPLVAVKWCTYQRAVLAGVLTVCASLLATLPNVLMNRIGQLDYVPTNDSCYDTNITLQKYYRILPSAKFTESEWATDLNYWLFAVVGKFLPCILLLIFTAFLIRVLQQAEIRQQRLRSETRRQSRAVAQSQSNGILRKKSLFTTNSAKSITSDRSSDYHQTTRMLLAVVISFTIVELPHGILLLWAKLSDKMIIYDLIGDVIDLATLTAFSINFVLYSIMSRQYRQLFIALLTKPFGHVKTDQKDHKRKLVKRRRSSFKTMHTEHSELHPLTDRKGSVSKNSRHSGKSQKSNNGVADV